MLITFSTQKGGEGKSTALLLVANALSQAPFHINLAVVDVDRQKSVAETRAFDIEGLESGQSVSYPVLDMDVLSFEAEINNLAQQYELILIDVPGKMDAHLPPEYQVTARVLHLVDYLFIPFTPGNFSLDAGLSYLDFVIKFKESRPDERPLHTWAFANKFMGTRKGSRFLSLELAEVKKAYGLNTMRNRLGNYAAFSRIDTLRSLYEPQSKQVDIINFTIWLHEFNKIIGL